MQLFLRLDIWAAVQSFPFHIQSEQCWRSRVSWCFFSHSMVFYQPQYSIIFCKLDSLFTLLCYKRTQKMHRGVFSEDRLSTHDEKKLNWDLHAMQPWKHSRTSASNPQWFHFWRFDQTSASASQRFLFKGCFGSTRGLCVVEHIFSEINSGDKFSWIQVIQI